MKNQISSSESGSAQSESTTVQAVVVGSNASNSTRRAATLGSENCFAARLWLCTAALSVNTQTNVSPNAVPPNECPRNVDLAGTSSALKVEAKHVFAEIIECSMP